MGRTIGFMATALPTGDATLTAGALAAVIAGPITATAMGRLPGYGLDIPWGWLTLIAGACIFASTLDGLIATARLRAVDEFRVR